MAAQLDVIDVRNCVYILILMKLISLPLVMDFRKTEEDSNLEPYAFVQMPN